MSAPVRIPRLYQTYSLEVLADIPMIREHRVWVEDMLEENRARTRSDTAMEAAVARQAATAAAEGVTLSTAEHPLADCLDQIEALDHCERGCYYEMCYCIIACTEGHIGRVVRMPRCHFRVNSAECPLEILMQKRVSHDC